jgi:cell pole-organizing protein PopZ
MSDNSSEEEPSIEEILASIRQIISDDDEEQPEAEKETEVLESPVREGTDDVLELTEEDLAEQESVQDSEPEYFSDDTPDIEMRDIEEIEPEPVYEPEPEPEPVYEEVEAPEPQPLPSDILSSGVQAAAMGSLAKLTKKMPINNSRSYDGVTLEDIVRELLHPMLREWMDDNLPPMVERIVQKEIEKMARRAMED